ncbi:MAG: alpha-glucan family phosphorylase [Gammaproteobacteria bacterium]
MTSPRYFRADLEEKLDGLVDLALDCSFSWSHAADPIWKELDAEFWQQTRNPWLVLQTVSRTRLEQLSRDEDFRALLSKAVAQHRQSLSEKRWFQETQRKNTQINTIAYFSMEFGLSEALPLYSGGLGLLAGDHLKAANDLGLPLVGVGLLYQNGYFRQAFDAEGNQIALYPNSDTSELPVCPVRNHQGEWLRIRLNTPSRLWVRVWQAQIGRIVLYLLDTNDPANHPVDRCITTQLYGGGPEHRLSQEILLGIGGWRVLRALDIVPEVCHLNEGHAALLVLERTRDLMREQQLDFHTALTVGRAGNLFTTHTPVEAGFDRFAAELIKSRLSMYADEFGISFETLLNLGRSPQQHGKPDAPFNMAYLAINGSTAVNAVSSLHADVSRQIFAPLFPAWPQTEIPVTHVTNGVHTPSWDSPQADELWTRLCGKRRWTCPPEELAKTFAPVGDTELWTLRCSNRTALVEFVREEYARELYVRENLTDGEMESRTRRLFDPNVLTIGFARRFATYKRPNLLLTDPDRLAALLTNPQRPVQLVIAGKAHPADRPGQQLIKLWRQFMQRPEIRERAIFLSDYDILTASYMVQGVDLWINTPRRPMEACGTSGMKALVNGGLNFSELDGWWAEAYRPEVGWSLDGINAEYSDAEQAKILYRRLENEIVPAFYRRDELGIPRDWVKMMRASMTALTPFYSANRMVREYTERFYLPLAECYRRRAENQAHAGKALAQWLTETEHFWPEIHIGNIDAEARDDRHYFKIQIYLGELRQQDVDVHLFADPRTPDDCSVHALEAQFPLQGARNGFLYSGSAPADRPISDYTPRIVPRHPDCAIPLEAAQIKWIV